jgi:acyl dehydratase
MKVRMTTLNQKGEPVQEFVGTLVVPRRPSA